MSRSEERPRPWRAEPEASSASGGHVTPPTGPLFDPLFDPFPSEIPGGTEVKDAAPQPAAPERGDVLPERPSRRGRRPRARPVPGRAAQPRTGLRRVRRSVKRVDPLSVLKLSLFYYSIFLVVWLAFVAVAYQIVEAIGVFDAIEQFGRGMEFEAAQNLNISLGFVERWALMIGAALVIVGSLVNAFLAFLYNIGSDLVGGLEVTFVERDL